ncbi:hypothetical protein, partial [Pseudomonas syringae group genomosp. 7]|uniref:hypothetical protein n=1 Tax=Pseudomonas syringae group genomosp. 7 TaxID=251699 RepID=UPI00376F8A57
QPVPGSTGQHGQSGDADTGVWLRRIERLEQTALGAQMKPQQIQKRHRPDVQNRGVKSGVTK